MLRGFPSITAVSYACVVLGGCSSGDRPAPPEVAVQADVSSVQCARTGAHQVVLSLLFFDAGSLELAGVDPRGRLVVTRLTSGTVLLGAPLELFPPDPIRCLSDAAAYDDLIEGGLTPSVAGHLAQLADDGCDASVALAPDGSVATFEPVP